KSKNDSEQNALKRFLKHFRSDHPKLKTILVTDALHANQPLLKELEKHQMSFILGVKPGSHEKLFAAIDKWDKLQRTNHLTREEEIGDKIKKKRVREYRYVNGMLLNHQDVNTAINYLEFWETIQWVDRKGDLKETKVHFSWVTDFSLYESNVEEMARLGRARWKIENETFNTLKNQGYEFEHNFGHGYKNLSSNFMLLMMLAFLVDQLQEVGCKLFGKALQTEFGKRSRLWEKFTNLYEFLPAQITDWNMFLSLIAEPEEWTLTRNTS
ncbi:MAG TPA: transposase, partial [Pseudobdellovibrionaceae bacterium]